jgi:UDPglucose 6-dehydrogenase
MLLTEWNEVRVIPPAKLKAAMAGDPIMDCRNAWDPVAMREAGLRYRGGRARPVKG